MIVVNDGFLRIMLSGRPNLWIPSVSTVARDLHSIYKQAVVQVSAALRVSIFQD